MYKFKTLKCYNCNSVITNLPEDEARKLEGLTFRCDCCNHNNLLTDMRFIQGKEDNIMQFIECLHVLNT
jgi:hypothetical protein